MKLSYMTEVWFDQMCCILEQGAAALPWSRSEAVNDLRETCMLSTVTVFRGLDSSSATEFNSRESSATASTTFSPILAFPST